MSNQTHHGQNGSFEVLPNNNLRITLSKEGRKEAKQYKDKRDEEFLWDMFEDIFCNSEFEMLRPEDIGALTDSVIMAFCVPKDKDGNIQKFDEQTKIWWFPNYMVTSIYDQLKNDQESVLTFAD